MAGKTSMGLRLAVLFSALLVLAAPAGSLAQGGSRQIFITRTDSSSAPTIELVIYGRDSAGGTIDFAATPIIVTQDGAPIPADRVEVLPGAAKVGTFTIFLVDIPSGVGGQIPAVQDAIKQFGAPPYMEEPVDFTAIFRVGAAAASPLQPATNFNNTIANAFATPLQAEAGSTALYDSVGGLLNNIETLRPADKPGLAVAMVVISDGTDAVSTEFEAGEVPALAASLGIPLHSIWLDNANLSTAKEEGRTYLRTLADQTGGLAAELNDPAGLTALWTQISSRRNQTLVRYTAEAVQGGEHTVSVQLASDPGASASTTFNLPLGAPTIVLEIPPESRALSLPNLDQPVELSFTTTVSWVDNTDRAITRAQLIVNGITVQEIPPDQVGRFTARINNFIFGQNQVQIAIVDEAGNTARSGIITLDIAQGDLAVPEEIQTPSPVSNLWQQVASYWVWIAGCLTTGVIALLLFAVVIFLRNSPLLRALGLSSLMYRIPFLRPYMREVAQVQRVSGQARRAKHAFQRYNPEVRGASEGGAPVTGGRPPAYLELLEAKSRADRRIELGETELRIGRSPNQADLALAEDITVSRLHATLVREGNDYRIFDEQSTSGSFVNEQRVPDYGIQLIDGDEIRLGSVRFRFRQP